MPDPNKSADEIAADLGLVLDDSVEVVAISAQERIGLDELLAVVERTLEIDAGFVPVRVNAPFDRGDVIALFHRIGRVEDVTFDESGHLCAGLLAGSPDRPVWLLCHPLGRRARGSGRRTRAPCDRRGCVLQRTWRPRHSGRRSSRPDQTDGKMTAALDRRSGAAVVCPSRSLLYLNVQCHPPVAAHDVDRSTSVSNGSKGLTYRRRASTSRRRRQRSTESSSTPQRRLATRGQPIGHFGGMYRLPAGPDRLLVASADGVGTKLKLAFVLGGEAHARVGGDIVNHCVGDILALGARPLFFLDYIALGKLVPETVESIVAGMAAACRDAGHGPDRRRDRRNAGDLRRRRVRHRRLHRRRGRA